MLILGKTHLEKTFHSIQKQNFQMEMVWLDMAGVAHPFPLNTGAPINPFSAEIFGIFKPLNVENVLIYAT